MNGVEEMRLEDGKDQIVARSEHLPKELSTILMVMRNDILKVLA